ncbi:MULTISPECIES: purine-nucleoside phosphorylase [unclassified Paenibacillus]|uniref:purine-nucleoside phosphorylase n=1 Tax=unclassified Paenibacillus TaxID=185978 RepID=UPI002405F551|nr:MULTISPECIES: purine-nucleoside phosphorylase [unclassified Paenibacillus]MDF9839439.1 purine-nucleoside phosphorylase [Paenibacillus sp. PastF-2]MDF9846019.1 purine-nucleoside phosphorylase [Paenibacillus sp. PastM-2]MDF9852592.1 purine-nucleoside phosphorylase [Paenibacillus sp. PastF-1]MDH6477677.1 purine-nucleoside phosphorylase [Paenibacillus sp. PastH-2]MDH6505417.1 purine-nucleoside phosphorylase [Paenibacillus sp. PastM-3]
MSSSQFKETPHIKPNGAEIAETILLPGDPLRAKFIAETYLENPVQFNEVRGMLGYTGTYKGKKISVMGTGMGVPSIGIYSWELINVFGVKNLIRIGSAGALQDNLNLYDIVFGMGASTNSNYASQFNLPGQYAVTASYELLEKAKKTADAQGQKVHIGNILTSDTFYNADKSAAAKWKDMGVLCIEMEAAALYLNAAQAGVNALCILTISDHIFRAEETTSEERQTSFTKMMEIALELA